MAGLFGRPKTPEVKPPAPMPDENDPAQREAARRRVSSMRATSGRRSTILSGEGMGSMGEDYSKAKLG